MAKFTPPKGSTGRFTVKAPFTIVPDALYTCIAVRSLTDITDLGGDPVALYYDAVGLTDTEYQADVAAGANIITLKSDTAPTLYLPDTWITSYPLLEGVPYNHVVLSVSLGLLRQDTPLGLLQEQIANNASDVIGIVPTVLVHVAPTTGVIDRQQSAELEIARQAAIVQRDSDYAKLTKAQREIERLHEQIQQLQDYIAAKDLLP